MGAVPWRPRRLHVCRPARAGADKDHAAYPVRPVKGVGQQRQPGHAVADRVHRPRRFAGIQSLVCAFQHLGHAQPARSRGAAGSGRVEGDDLPVLGGQPVNQGVGARQAGSLAVPLFGPVDVASVKW